MFDEKECAGIEATVRLCNPETEDVLEEFILRLRVIQNSKYTIYQSVENGYDDYKSDTLPVDGVLFQI